MYLKKFAIFQIFILFNQVVISFSGSSVELERKIKDIFMSLFQLFEFQTKYSPFYRNSLQDEV